MKSYEKKKGPWPMTLIRRAESCGRCVDNLLLSRNSFLQVSKKKSFQLGHVFLLRWVWEFFIVDFRKSLWEDANRFNLLLSLDDFVFCIFFHFIVTTVGQQVWGWCSVCWVTLCSCSICPIRRFHVAEGSWWSIIMKHKGQLVGESIIYIYFLIWCKFMMILK